MHHTIRLGLAAFVAVAMAALGVGVASAASSIRIKVDDQPITSYDIAQRTALLKLTGGGGEKAAIQELIDETLQFIEAAKLGVSVSESRVDFAIEDIAKRTKMTPAKLKSELAAQGVNIDTLRRRIKAQMTWQTLVDVKIHMDGASVKGSDVTAALFEESGGSGQIKTTEYILQQIIFVVPKGSSSALLSQRRREAEAFRGRFPGCDQSVAMAKQLKGVVVKNLGRRTDDELSGPDAKEIKGTAVGKTTSPMKTDAGYQLIAVCRAKSVDSNAAAVADAENKLMLEQNKDLGKEYMEELRKKAIIQYL
ncbi:MAG: SurA N-terminal domain-containing protein [Bauldia sp.]|nr:SurA N-terminal domain-containing protein [Bauldia sp.]